MGPGEASPEKAAEGVVLRRSSNTVWVDLDGVVVSCALRGKLRREEPCVAGDRVRVALTGGGEGVLEEILPRRTELRRGAGGDAQGGQALAANIDQVAVVLATKPEPRWGLADRLLVESERQGLEAMVVLNKMDLVPETGEERRGIEEAVAVYRAAGVVVAPVSAATGAGLDGLRPSLARRATVFSGHSGVGKSTLLNALHPGLDIRTGDVNPLTGKGRQTTTSVVLVRLPEGGYATDTPGFREFALLGLDPPELGRLYPEFREAIAACRFKDCLHRDEPGCGVRRALEEGRISKLRYNNYLNILASLEAAPAARPQRRSARRWSS